MVYTNGKKSCIHPLHIIRDFKVSVHVLELKKQGIVAHMLDIHPLQYRGAMELKLSGKSDTLNMKFFPWSILIFLQYIHEHISYLSKVFSTDISNQIPFQNIEAIER